MSDRASNGEAREFATAFRSFLTWVHSGAGAAGTDEVVSLVRDFLGPERAAESVVTRELAPFEHVNLQAAVDAWSTEQGREVVVRGIALAPQYGGVSLPQLISGDALPPLRLSAPALVDLPNGPGSTLACLRLAVLQVDDAHGRYVILVSGPSENQPGLSLEIAGLPVASAQDLHTELDALRSKLNVYRGHVVEISVNQMGGVTLTFAALPITERAEVVLPAVVLNRIERHALGVAAHRAALLGAGQHLKRGLLLFGPPGTGKTHTTRYLVGRMRGYTRLLLSGRSLHTIGSVIELARELQPAVVVLEDVDLVAQDRSFGPGSSPVLFDLLDAMDGAAADADLLFLLTTNRADLLEAALAARPGRVDVAVEIGLPDADARRRLFNLYGRNVPLELTDEELDATIERTDGVTASFLKELIRRAVLEALDDDATLTVVSGTHVSLALDDLLDSAQQVTRSLLGIGADATEPSPGIAPASPDVSPTGWVGYAPYPRGRPRRYGEFRN